jgi:hypothetical protein
MWQEARQWLFLGGPKLPRWLAGVVSLWHRSQASGSWHVAQLVRSIAAVSPCPRLRQKFVWLTGSSTRWQAMQDDDSS